ncbi:hypothetical protein BD324DRAFT_286794 [Kockovaella imperatae]|uniref:UDP-glycosyltransferases domain-containing protein n=1 Tax=Kockovaella imperatae TaxID=4999 RepID=A0A1Y1U704_9TREE|nr:hypothetical protein BD324DRAFT_286794 [Kockovaella imperatae]ORX33306.1 hypothetical protein BD324DRAFT_286794 [Kockovaella imperatae]
MLLPFYVRKVLRTKENINLFLADPPDIIIRTPHNKIMDPPPTSQIYSRFTNAPHATPRTMPHLVIVPLSIVSHTRSTLGLALNLLNIHPTLRVTWCTTTYGLPCLLRELARHPPPDHRWNVVEMKDTLEQSEGSYADSDVVKREFPAVLARLDATAVLIDMFRPVADAVRRVKPGIPLLGIMPSLAFTAFWFIGRDEDGAVMEKIMERYEGYRATMDHDVAAMKAFRHIKGKLLDLPELPPLYDYELSPQCGSRAAPPSPHALQAAFDTSRQVDAMLWLSTPELEEDTLALLSRKLEKPMIGIGCQSVHTPQPVVASAALEHLDKVLTTHGPGSAVYISFGSLFWPRDRPDILDTIIDTLSLRQTPFVIASPVPLATGPLGCAVQWAPQAEILEHGAVGTFITHCGMGAMMETIMAEVPIIALPFGSEQPQLAAYYTSTHRIGIHLHHFASLEGLPLGNGLRVDNTLMRRELEDALDLIISDRPALQVSITKLKHTMVESSHHGAAFQAMQNLSTYF